VDKFGSLIDDVILATLVAVVAGEADYGTIEMKSGEVADAKREALSTYAALEARNAELEAWAQRAVLYVTDDRLSETGRELLEGADGRDG